MNKNKNMNMKFDPNDVQTRPNMVLTRYLYPKDEVELSLMLALLQKKSVNECIFWASELIYSGFGYDITLLIWSIYYDFYAQLNPNLIHKINNSLKSMLEGNVEPLFEILKTLRVRPSTDNVFSLRISQTPTQFSIYKGRTPNWLTKYPNKHRVLLRSICNYDWNKIIMYIRSKIDEPKKLVKSILNVMLEKKLIYLKNENEYPDIDALWDNYGYNDDFHIILALIVGVITNDEKVDFSSRIIKLNETETQFVCYVNSPIPNAENKVADANADANANANADADAAPSEYAYDMLLKKRLFAINPYVSAFDIVRQRKNILELETKQGFINEIGTHWAYHVSQTPYWQNEFNKVNAIVNNNGELLFNGDDYEENFCLFDLKHAYCYNLDESYMKEMWMATCSDVSDKNVQKDIVDIMEEIFGDDEKETRMEFDDLLLSNKKQSYPNVGRPPHTRLSEEGDAMVGDSNNVPSQNSFDFTLLNKILDSV